MMDFLKQWITKHEGLILKPYRCTAGKLTIGVGRNIEDNGISRAEAELLLENDIRNAVKDLERFEWYVDQPTHVKYALINLRFNIGMPRLLGFKKMIKALEDKDYTLAAKEALDSKWAKQVGRRATDVAMMMRNEK